MTSSSAEERYTVYFQELVRMVAGRVSFHACKFGASREELLDRKGLMGWVCLSVCLSVMPLLQHLENHMSKGNKGNRPERQLAALAKQALRTSVYI